MIYNKKYIIDNWLLDSIQAEDVELYTSMQHYYTSLDNDEFKELIYNTYQLEELREGYYI